MGKRRQASGKSMAQIMVGVVQKKVAEREKLRQLQHAGSAEERERIEAKQEGREAFADSGRWGHLDQHGKSVEPEPRSMVQAAAKQNTKLASDLKIQKTAATAKKKKAAPKPVGLSSAVSGTLGSTSGGSVRL